MNKRLEFEAANYAKINNWFKGALSEQKTVEKIMNEAFKAGAEWQKEQLSLLITLIKEAQSVLLNEGLDELSEKIDSEIERLQDGGKKQ